MLRNYISIQTPQQIYSATIWPKFYWSNSQLVSENVRPQLYLGTFNSSHLWTPSQIQGRKPVAQAAWPACRWALMRMHCVKVVSGITLVAAYRPQRSVSIGRLGYIPPSSVRNPAPTARRSLVVITVYYRGSLLLGSWIPVCTYDCISRVYFIHP